MSLSGPFSGPFSGGGDGGRGETLLFAAVRNLGNVLAYSASTSGSLRALSPLPGRSVSAGLRLSF